ncbi:MAG: low molecular weight phosphotyrosine protein phosphatase [Bacteroidetes bacterium]|nr:MAG: low molecular weight phosphotyrosine protein phosphatase [Bacteroidota bacterium]RLD74067.1 MAG: low molecular weight phosphotyrosine protein phosphatase [Bacteroidota bacterium]RLD88561.1 MAG: low molecular weight phosphotyrosine protein phosphatase [Bacteroidota bacterium]
MNILFVCMGNMGRSPLAKALLLKKYKENGIDAEVDSAGFETFNINEEPDPRIKDLGKKHGVEVTGKARIFVKDDFAKFDRIYVMDTRTYRDVKELAKNKEQINKIDYLMNLVEPGKNKIVPCITDAWNTDPDAIFNMLDKATDKIIENVTGK